MGNILIPIPIQLEMKSEDLIDVILRKKIKTGHGYDKDNKQEPEYNEIKDNRDFVYKIERN